MTPAKANPKPIANALSHSEALAKRFQGRCRFVTSAADCRKIPDFDLAEIALIGRSNCGKSSLLNAIMGSKSLARTSNTPGRTRLFNAFAVADELILMDLPGYGYAKISQQQRQSWFDQWQGYVQTREKLCHVLVLIDARRGFMPLDREMMTILDAVGKSYTVILTKADKLPKSVTEELLNTMTMTLLQHPAAHGIPMISSAKSRLGIDPLRQKVLCSIGQAAVCHSAAPGVPSHAESDESTSQAVSDMIHHLRKNQP